MAAGLLAFFIALFASLMLVVPVRALALRVGMVDLPGPRKVHLTPIPLLGGLAMYAAVVMAVLFAFNGPARAQVVGILIGATLVAVVGILDDRGLLHHQVKLFVGMPLAAAILLISGIRAQVFSVLLGGRAGDFLDAGLTVVWVVGITASFSILDHMDGLCAGVAAMASVFFAMLAYLNGQTLVTTLAAAVLGAAAGFLRWNFKPAKIFMGDGGAMLTRRWSRFPARGAACCPSPRPVRTTRLTAFPILASGIAVLSLRCICSALSAAAQPWSSVIFLNGWPS